MISGGMDSLRIPAGDEYVRAKSVIIEWFSVAEVFSLPGFWV
jgi:hypothetical protein